MADRGELDAVEAKELFDWLRVKMSLMMTYNREANRKDERGHGTIVKAIVRTCDMSESATGRGSYLTCCGRTELRTVR